MSRYKASFNTFKDCRFKHISFRMDKFVFANQYNSHLTRNPGTNRVPIVEQNVIYVSRYFQVFSERDILDCLKINNSEL